ncbi:MAG TPA: LapA family protein [Rhodanobacteraceae bacterium]|nr:LapA family protein [Rhodanobacteraceae bacterium]
MRLVIVVLIVLLFILAGIVFGALNPAMVVYDLGFAQVPIPKGAAILGALFVGWLAGGIVAWLGAGASFRRQRKIGQPAAKKTAPSDGS